LFVRLALYTGARTRAILDLKWNQVDLERGRIDYNPAGRRQTHKKRPVVAIGGRLTNSLRRVRNESSGPFVISYRGKEVARVIKGFREAARRAGLEDVTPHTLRHTAATWMAQGGLPLPLIAGMLGQSITRTTERYIKHSPDFMAGAAEALERGKVLGR
jgi:integrase